MMRYLFWALCLVILVAGCGKEAQEAAMEKKIEDATGGKADVDLAKEGMKVTGETEEGKYTVTAGEETEIPEGFPSDVFIYRPSKAVVAMKVPEGYSVTLNTQDDKAKVLEAYKREMADKGWSEEGSMSMGGTSALVYEKNGRTANITLAPSDEGLQINVSVVSE